jgi:hypothetical protein
MMTSPRLMNAQPNGHFGLFEIRRLSRERAFDRINDRGEDDQRTTADQFDNTTMMIGNGGMKDGLAVALQRGQRARFLDAYHERVAGEPPAAGCFDCPRDARREESRVPSSERENVSTTVSTLILRPVTSWSCTKSMAQCRSARGPDADRRGVRRRKYLMWKPSASAEGVIGRGRSTSRASTR